MSRLDKERQIKLEPNRIEYAKKKIMEIGFDIFYESKTEIRFYYKSELVRLFPYTGWHSGKSIKDGRGLNNLLSQIK